MNHSQMFEKAEIAEHFHSDEQTVVFPGDCLQFLEAIPDETFQLVVTSPPYNLGKEYEKRIQIDEYVEQQRRVIRECVRALKRTGSICWEVGNYVDQGTIIALDAILFPVFRELGLQCRNRIVWHFEHGLHCNRKNWYN
jgi:adenine-specific DNA-methyltransferase